ncbi:MAG TPA: rhodanese-like domain-containing protein [Rariglobus sp.]|nr:rhodanese-like domain-containing protein [Rariglobus sp.]
MKHIICLFSVLVLSPLAAFCAGDAAPAKDLANPLIDYTAYRQAVQRVEPIREKRRLTEAEFQAKMREPGVVLFDARSGPMFARLHIEGAVNLTFPDFTEERLAKIIPTKDTLVLIYCNNNFLGSPVAMASKIAPASLNVSTYVTLNSYGYTNIYELGPLLDVKKTVLPLAGTEAASHERKAVQ